CISGPTRILSSRAPNSNHASRSATCPASVIRANASSVLDVTDQFPALVGFTYLVSLSVSFGDGIGKTFRLLRRCRSRTPLPIQTLSSGQLGTGNLAGLLLRVATLDCA